MRCPKREPCLIVMKEKFMTNRGGFICSVKYKHYHSSLCAI